jgi:predicted acetyltransferase
VPTREIRPLTPSDAGAAHALQAEAFGARPEPAPDGWPGAGTRAFGAFTGGALAATAHVHGLASWFGGRPVATAGIANVAVRPEERGTGLLAPLFAAVTADARERGEAVSTLFPTAPGIYRRLGYELVGELVDVEVPVAALPRVAPAEGVTLRRAGPGDHEAARAVYDRWAAAQDGPLTRRTAARGFLDDHHALTLAVVDGAVAGYAAWASREGYSADRSAVEVRELVAVSAPATAALWRLLGGFGSTAATVRLRTSGADPARLVLPAAAWRPVAQWPYGLRVLDVAAALTARGVNPLDATLPFSVAGVGAFRLVAAGGTAHCERLDRPAGPADHGGPVFTGNGLALAYAGVQSCANLRFAGLLTGPDTDDARWDALLGGRPFHVRDHF